LQSLGERPAAGAKVNHYGVKLINILRKAALVSIVSVGVTFGSGAVAGPLPTFNIVLGNGTNATAYFVGFEAGDTDTVSVVAGLANFFVNQSTPIGTSAALGIFGTGVEIEFAMNDLSVPAIWYTGPGSRNADGDVHANVTTNIADISGLSAASYAYAATFAAGTVFVGFEDRPGNQSDFDYNDLVFAVVNGRTARLVPEPESLALLGAGLMAMVVGRRKRA
jgi:hypothetical protein